MKTEQKVMRLMLTYVKRQFNLILPAFLAGALCAGCGVAGSDLIRRVIDGLKEGTLHNTAQILLMCGGILVVGTASAWLTRYASGRGATKIIQNIKDETTAYIVKVTAAFLSEKRSGDILSRLTDDINQINTFVQNNLVLVITNPFLLIFYICYLLYLNPLLFLISIIPIIICLPFASALTTKFKSGSRRYMQYAADVISASADMLGGMEVVKSFSLQEVLLRDYRNDVKKMTDMSIENDRNQYKGQALFIFSGTLSSILCLMVGGWLCLQGSLSLGGLMAFFALLPSMVEAINDLTYLVFNSKVALTAAERVFEIRFAPTEATGTVFYGKEGTSAACFRDVSFAYEEGVSVLSHVSFHVERGQTVAVVGASGGGKSTLLRLLCGFYRPSGKILVEGINIDDWNLEALRARLSYVSQHAYLFPVSVGENIAMGKPGATIREIQAAARAANADGFIQELPDGYDTLVGERGSRLSGGQIQRISIARAILKDAPILLLDEATSALDVQAESDVQKALDRLSHGRTTLVVAHRLSTIQKADCIVVLDQGSVAEQGTHEELLAHGRVYPKLYAKYAGTESKQINAPWKIKDKAICEICREGGAE
jgi:subfamily B ATP-binding cassette protein MsbA/ATP-binding cassette subfamily B protein AbcA/BmrA